MRRLVLLSCLLLGAAHGTAVGQDESEVERGRYLVTAADCAACHTAPGGAAFAGGRAIATPFGTLYAPNITSDRETGIGTWSDDDLYKALHSGRGHGDAHLYPAFPYPYFTRLTREDVVAMRAYLATVPPVKNVWRAATLWWPLRYRFLMTGWNLLYFDEGTFRPNPDKSAAWNRGAYLVQALGHCGACHTPKTMLGGDRSSHALEGGLFDNWLAPNITGDSRIGIGRWSEDDVVEYLATGHNAHTDAAGPMAEVIASSTSKLHKEDLRAIAIYLKDQKGSAGAPMPAPPRDVMAAGEKVYDICAACHEDDGKGQPRLFTPLAGNAAVQSPDPTTIIRLTLQGADGLPTASQPTPGTMPGYRSKLSDEQIAAVLTYIRNSWGNSAPMVSASDVKALRERLHAPQ
ncbi:MAG TPA: cytochrome c [Reyranella sp.]|nr:cytochrome c [Reyranella sp.]